MRIAAMVLAYAEDELLKACLKQFPDFVQTIMVAVSEKPWNGGSTELNGKTLEVVRQAMERDNRVQLAHFNWRSENDQRNWVAGRFADYDWILVVDADEFYTPEDWVKLRDKMFSAHSAVATLSPKSMKTYWKTMDYRWSPEDSHSPAIAIRPSRNVFTDKRDVTDKMRTTVDVVMHHLSWVRTDEDVERKISNWAHALDFDTEKWYYNTWKAWTPDMKGLRPYGLASESDTRAILDPLPECIRNLFAG